MRTVVPDPPPAEFAQLLERRRRAGADHHDEIWEGVLHVAPAPSHRHGKLVVALAMILGAAAKAAGLEATAEINLGEPQDYRVPDLALHRPGAASMWHPTAALLVEVLFPGEESQDKLPFYATHRVDELLIVDPDARTVEWLALGPDGAYHQVQRSSVIGLGARELAARIDWP
jgi:hypothetical protein